MITKKLVPSGLVTAFAVIASLPTGGISLAQDAENGGDFPTDTPVCYNGGNRGHIEGCPRLTAEQKAAGPNTTYAEMKAKGGKLCSRCPGRALNKERMAGSEKKDNSKEEDETDGKGETNIGPAVHYDPNTKVMYEAMPECGTDDDFMTAIANAPYHNSQTKNGSVQCHSADKKRPMSRQPFGAPRDRFYLLEAFHDGIIDGQCSKLSKAGKEAKLSEYSHRLKTFHAMYMKALSKDRSLACLGENI